MNKIKNILVVGNSMSNGCGLQPGVDNWVDLMGKHLDANVRNVSVTGANNAYVFTETMWELSQDITYDAVLVVWSTIPQYNFHMGLETYAVFTRLNRKAHSLNIRNNETISEEWLRDLGERLKKYHNDHWDNLNLVRYVNALIHKQNQYKENSIFFVNSLIKYGEGFWTRRHWDYPNELDWYTQRLLEVDIRSDEEIRALYNMIHDQYDSYGGIHEHLWYGLYNPFKVSCVDVANDDGDKHPGPESQIIYGKELADFLQEKLS